MKSCLCKESNEEFDNYFKPIEHKYKTRNNSKSIKLPPVKLAKQGFYFSGEVLYNSLPIEIRNTDGYGKFKEMVKAIFRSILFIFTFSSNVAMTCSFHFSFIFNITFYSLYFFEIYFPLFLLKGLTQDKC